MTVKHSLQAIMPSGLTDTYANKSNGVLNKQTLSPE